MERFVGRTLSHGTQLQTAAATWRIKTRNSDSAFYQITLVFVSVRERKFISKQMCENREFTTSTQNNREFSNNLACSMCSVYNRISQVYDF